MDKNELMEKIDEILEKELYGYNEGCTGLSCNFQVKGVDSATRKINELIEQWEKENNQTLT